eukprot:MONOS_468.1-p1 / transcript=MONOS_468.1 / gene=MONOS_468 / organism=Monocercomonoides_exilis_PA203 / gene_product=unspecified product / transcript_product=unspecified product / location=Mono_scaffold00007:208782-210112(+) / protein_length=399 / sequence_SO=supercontig / SO=protein_coding / is_pseudo=false
MAHDEYLKLESSLIHNSFIYSITKAESHKDKDEKMEIDDEKGKEQRTIDEVTDSIRKMWTDLRKPPTNWIRNEPYVHSKWINHDGSVFLPPINNSPVPPVSPPLIPSDKFLKSPRSPLVIQNDSSTDSKKKPASSFASPPHSPGSPASSFISPPSSPALSSKTSESSATSPQSVHAAAHQPATKANQAKKPTSTSKQKTSQAKEQKQSQPKLAFKAMATSPTKRKRGLVLSDEEDEDSSEIDEEDEMNEGVGEIEGSEFVGELEELDDDQKESSSLSRKRMRLDDSESVHQQELSSFSNSQSLSNSVPESLSPMLSDSQSNSQSSSNSGSKLSSLLKKDTISTGNSQHDSPALAKPAQSQTKARALPSTSSKSTSSSATKGKKGTQGHSSISSFFKPK